MNHSPSLRTPGKTSACSDSLRRWLLVAALLPMGARSHRSSAQTAGRVDTSFDPGSGADTNVRAIAVQGDGRIVLVGDFKNVNGAGHVGIARLKTDGGLDESFTTSTDSFHGTFAVAVQPGDGKIILGGRFLTVNGVACRAIAAFEALVNDTTSVGLVEVYGLNPPS